MKFSEQWLREWVNPPIATDDLVAQLTMAGLEVDSVEPVAADFSGVIVAEVLSVKPHPEADRLRLCEVNTGSETVAIVCGGKNVREQLKVALVQVGGVMPGGMKIKKAKLRGEPSFGMLCSSSELGLTETSDGILELPDDAPVGTDLREYLQLDDVSIDVDLTPNRGDCLSIAGIAREAAVLTKSEWTAPEEKTVVITCDDALPVTLSVSSACPHYVGRVIRGIDMHARSSLWLQERLRRSGLRSIHPVVDVTNYVMLECGQPMHAFDLNGLTGGIDVRMARAGETLTLLDERTVTVDDNTLLIADQKGPLALAGIMGGLASAVTDGTVDLFLESAFFAPEAIAGHARRYHLSTDSSHRFERGVDPTLQVQAIERATCLLLDIVGGQAGPITEVGTKAANIEARVVTLRPERAEKILGLAIEEEHLLDMLQRLGMTVFSKGERWEVRVPTYRFDISIEEDLIEEVARIYGYDNLPTHFPMGTLSMQSTPETQLSKYDVACLLQQRGYHDIISYSFVDPKVQSLLHPGEDALDLENPLSTELSQLQLSLWSGLITAALYNQHRQQTRLRLFEQGLCFIPRDDGLLQKPALAGLMMGTVNAEQWGEKSRPVDFFDIKNDVDALFRLSHIPVEYVAADYSALHPGQSARLSVEGVACGWIGALHPRIERELGFNHTVYLFHVDFAVLSQGRLPHYTPLSKFPELRRDLSFLVNDAIPAAAIVDEIRTNGGDLVKNAQIFDLYEGKGVPEGKKSLALSLTLCDSSRTLIEKDIVEAIAGVISLLEKTYGIELRD